MTQISNGFFITGTDTNIGKTVFASILLKTLKLLGYKTTALKPVACTENTKYSRDALCLKKFTTEKLSYPSINPFLFPEPISPHIAAKNAKINLTVKKIIMKSKNALQTKSDFIVIEGAGGIYTPINLRETMLDLIKAYKFPVILVVGLRVGSLNHTLLTLEALKKHKIKLAGWVANIIEPQMKYIQENIDFIQQKSQVPLLMVIPHKK